MAIESVSIHNNLVFRDDVNTWRWLDAIGPDVLKFVDHFTRLPTDDQTGDPTEFTMTVVEVGTGSSTAVLDTDAGGLLLLTCAGNEDDGPSLQLKGEAFDLSGDYPTYFGCRIRVVDVDQMDYLFGLCITDTDLLAGMTDGIYFRSVDGDATVSFVLEKGSAESATELADASDATWMTLEFLYYAHNVYVYVDGSLTATIADTSTSFPDDEVLTVSMEVLNGEAVEDNAVEVDWLRCIQVHA